MQWRIDTIRAVDKDCLIAAHGVGGAIPNMAAGGSDDWLAASKVELYGLTWVPSRRGFKPWQNFFGPDITRAAARGKKWWHAERPGGPLWLQPQVLGRDKEDGRVMDPEDVRTLTMTSFAAGATGVMNLRYRPLLDGPLFGAFGSYGMDGSRTPRSDEASRIAKWANAPEQKPLWEARPVKGDIALLVIPEAQAWDYLLNHNHKPETYREAMWGAYRGFLDNGLQPDWVHIDHIADYDTIYAPYPIMLTAEHAKALAAWVEKGGTLISEATPGYFGDRGKVGTVQPHNGLDVVFGVARKRGRVHARHRRPHPLRPRRRAGRRRRVPPELHARPPASRAAPSTTAASPWSKTLTARAARCSSAPIRASPTSRPRAQRTLPTSQRCSSGPAAAATSLSTTPLSSRDCTSAGRAERSMR